MKGTFLIRWAIVALVLAAVVGLAYQRYARDVASIAPEAYSGVENGKAVRVLGRIRAGSLQNVVAAKSAEFVLEGGNAQVRVLYSGPDTETLRDLKTILASGTRQPDGSFLANQVAISPNYEFITLAFGLIAAILVVFTFVLEWRVSRWRSMLDEPGIEGGKAS